MKLKNTLIALSFWIVNSIAFATTHEINRINIVSAENFYGDVANQLGKPYIQVTSIMSNPNQDPHMFNASPKMAMLIDKADIVIENGMGYDAWMGRLYVASHKKAVLLNVSSLVIEPMDENLSVNPHIWYDPKVMPVFAKKLTEHLILCEPEHKAIYEKNLAEFLDQADAYQKALNQAKEKIKGTSVTATEPVLGYLVEALGLKMLNQTFQQNVMNEADLTPKEIIDFEKSLNNRQVKLLIYNAQVMDSTTDNLKKLALKNNIPILGVNETMPANEHYYDWMNHTLEALEKALL